MSEPSRVSIVIPTYNRADLLRESAVSVLDQAHADLEVIIVDDGSTDSTPELLAELTAEYPVRLRTVRQDNGGQAAATNRGFELATGEYAGYLSSDDLLLPGAVARLAAALDDDPDAAAAYPDFHRIDAAGARIGSFELEDFTLTAALLAHDPIIGPGALFRREVLDHTGGMDGQFATNLDFEFWLRLALLGDVVHVREPLAEYRVHTESTSIAARGPEMAGRPVALIDHFFERDDLPPEIEEIKGRAYAAAYVVGSFMAAEHDDRPDRRFFIADRRASAVSSSHAEQDVEAQLAAASAEAARQSTIAQKREAALEEGRLALERRLQRVESLEEEVAELKDRVERKQAEIFETQHALAQAAYDAAPWPRRLARRIKAAARRHESQGSEGV